MNILFLGYNQEDTKLISFLKNKNNSVLWTDRKVGLDDVMPFDWVISFGYRYIISEDIIKAKGNRVLNLHISYLPYNRGSHPNYWSFVEGTPSGVTIHLVAKGLDTGDILLQKEINFDTKIETFSSSYKKLIEQIEHLFMDNYSNLMEQESITPIKQDLSKGSYRKSSEVPKDIDWNSNIYNYIQNMRTDSEVISDIEKIRARNNVNWMDAVRLAFELAPDRARKIFKDIKECDYQINELLKELADNEKKS
jgi:methionyl-tRNA formyltransferase